MKIGELSRVTKVSIPTIRLYEREGLIEPAQRTPGLSREFSGCHEKRLRFIKKLRGLGFTLEEVKALLATSIGASHIDTVGIVDHILEGIAQRRSDLALLEKFLQGRPSVKAQDLDNIFENG